MEKNWLFLTWQWNTSTEAEPRLSIALCFHNKSDTKSNTFRLAFFAMISIIIIIISVITGFALQYQFLEEVGSIGVSLWGQRVGWWWSWLTAPDRAQAPVSVAERCSGRSVCRLARIFRNLAIYNFVEFAFKQMLAKKKKYLHVSMTTGTMKRCSQWREDGCHPITVIIFFLNNLSNSLLPPRSTIWFASADKNGINEV